MKYDELPARLQCQAIEMVMDFCQYAIDDAAKNNGTKPWKVNKDSIEVQDILEEWEFEIDIDEITGEEILSRV
jgi:hypothetical protein